MSNLPFFHLAQCNRIHDYEEHCDTYEEFRDKERFSEYGYFKAPEIPVTTDKRTPIAHNLLDPHYADSRFDHSKTHTIFLAPGNKVGHDWPNDGFVMNAQYSYSDRVHQWYYDKYDAAVEIARKKAKGYNTAMYYEELLKILMEKPKLILVHIIAGVNVSSGYSYLIFGTKEK